MVAVDLVFELDSLSSIMKNNQSRISLHGILFLVDFFNDSDWMNLRMIIQKEALVEKFSNADIARYCYCIDEIWLEDLLIDDEDCVLH